MNDGRNSGRFARRKGAGRARPPGTLAARRATDEREVRRTVADALGLPEEKAEVRGNRYAPLREVTVGAGEGRACADAYVEPGGEVTVEIVGRTAEGTCLPGLGGH